MSAVLPPRGRPAALLLAGLLLAAGPAARAQVREGPDAAETLPPAPLVLARVRASFPAEPLLVLAQLVRLDARGRTERTLNARMLLDWHGANPSAVFRVADAFGAPLAQLAVERPFDGPARYAYAEGDPAEEKPLQSMQDAVAGTDFTWADLALSFLWWPGGTTRALATKKGRTCYVVDVPAPDAEGPFDGVRLWVDTRVFALLEAEARDAGGRVVKRLEVKSLKKVDGVWTLKDLEVRNVQERTRTRLRVLDTQRLGAAREPAADGPPGGGKGTPVP